MEAKGEPDNAISETENPQMGEDVPEEAGGVEPEVEAELPDGEAKVTERVQDEKSDEGSEGKKSVPEETQEDEEDDEYDPNEEDEGSSEEDEDAGGEDEEAEVGRRAQSRRPKV